MEVTDPNVAPEGKTYFIDKPLQWTSFDVVKKIRGLTRFKKVGHAGTLDPLATGLLIICAGKKTKQINEYQGMPKEYTGTFVLGKTTPSYDLETAVNSEMDVSHLTENDVINAFQQFQGKIWQAPPAFSAVKIKGKRAYDIARRGDMPEIKKKEVEIFEFECLGIQFPEVNFRLKCSKGFYVRSLAHDLGTLLRVGAYLNNLRRTKIGTYTVDEALTIDELSSQYCDKSL